jgi:hypothetical protein
VSAPFGLAFVNPSALVAFGPFVHLGGERTTVSIPIPGTPAGSQWNGLPLAFQIGHLYLTTGTAELSNPTIVALY